MNGIVAQLKSLLHRKACAAHNPSSRSVCDVIPAAEYAGLHDTINSILSRCRQVQQRLGSSNTSAINSSSSHCPTYLSMRSQLLFEAPDAADEGAGSAAHVEVQQQPAAGSKAFASQQQQQQRPASPAWGGAVDLNPAGSFSFPPSEFQTLG
jgi:hypothetical protein